MSPALAGNGLFIKNTSGPGECVLAGLKEHVEYWMRIAYDLGFNVLAVSPTLIPNRLLI